MARVQIISMSCQLVDIILPVPLKSSFSLLNVLDHLRAAYISGKEFQGRRIKVSMARRKPMMGGMRGGMPMRGGPGMDRGGKINPQASRNLQVEGLSVL